MDQWLSFVGVAKRSSIFLMDLRESSFLMEMRSIFKVSLRAMDTPSVLEDAAAKCFHVKTTHFTSELKMKGEFTKNMRLTFKISKIDD